MTELQSTLAQVLSHNTYKELTTALVKLIIDNPEGRIDPLARNELLRQYNIRRISDIKEQSLSVVLAYAEQCLEDGVMTDEEIKNMTLLKAYFGIEEGDFYRNNRQADVHRILSEQLTKMYADGVIDRNEAMLQSEMQGMFGLSYGEYESFINDFLKK